MKLISAALAVALTPAFVALPTVSFASPDKPRPVAPVVASSAIAGVDEAELAAAPRPRATLNLSTPRNKRDATYAGPGRGERPQVLTRKRSVAPFTVAGVSWSGASAVASKDITINVRVRESGSWGSWQTLSIPDEGPDAGAAEARTARTGTVPLVSSGANGIQVRVDTATGVQLPDLKVTTIDPGQSEADDDLVPTLPPGTATAAATQPSIITRAAWGADEKLRKPTTLNSTVKAITIHHTAGTNNYTPETAAAQVRGIYAYDTLGLGWSDIAYNFLVDKWGRIYEGRAGSLTQAVRGAHAMGFNVDTMGVSAMGNYETAAAPAVMVDAMAKVAGWKLSQYGRDPLGKTQLVSQGGTGAKFGAGVTATLPVINPHQDTSYTLCPGKYLSPALPALRTKAANYAKYSALTPPAANPVTATSQLYATYGSVTLKVGSSGAAVKAAQTELNRRGHSVGVADGQFGPMTAAAVSAFQSKAQLVVTGVIAANDWKALSGLAYTKVVVPTPKPTPPPPTAVLPSVAGAGFDADGRGDMLGRSTTGDLYLYRGALRAFSSGLRIGTGWNMFTEVVAPGDVTGDGKADILARTSAGALYLYAGSGTGGVLPGRVIGQGWQQFNTVVGAGDLTGDKRPDLLARRPDGKLFLYAGAGSGRFAPARQVGTGWQMFNLLITPGDFTGDGKSDLMGRTPAGKLYLYPGTGKGTFTAGKVIGVGWHGFNAVTSTGDVTGDRKADLVARTSTGASYVYAGTGKGAFAAGRGTLTPPWVATTRIFGAR